MKVQVRLEDGAVLSYEAPDDIEVGESVKVPPPFWNNSGPPSVGVVVVIGSDYQGRLVEAWR